MARHRGVSRRSAGYPERWMNLRRTPQSRRERLRAAPAEMSCCQPAVPQVPSMVPGEEIVESALALVMSWGTPSCALRFTSLLDSLIQRLEHARIHRCDHIHRRIQLLFRHPRLPCVRKATIHSRIAEPHHRDGETDQHLLAIGQAFDRVRIAIEGSKIGFLHITAPLASRSRVSCPESRVPDNPKPETRNPKLITSASLP